MGYFSNYALDYEADYEDNSYPSPEKQLMWRLEDLQSRWEELKEYSAPHPKYDAGLRLSDNDVRYAIPEYFTSVRDVERAMRKNRKISKKRYPICRRTLKPKRTSLKAYSVLLTR